MSGKLIMGVRRGKSLDPRYPCYPEWYLLVLGEDGQEPVAVSPTYDELATLFHEIFVHEFLNDWMRGRNPDFTRKRIKFDLPTLLENAQTYFEQHWKNGADIPKIYHICNRPRDVDD